MVRRFGFLDKNCCSAGGCEISLIQSHILYEIDRRHKPSMQQVAEALGTDITTFSRQVQTLVKMNLVKKSPDPNDRRVHLLSLTAESSSVDELKAMLAQSGFADIVIELKEESRMFVKDWVPGSKMEDYITSAVIKAVKPQ